MSAQREPVKISKNSKDAVVVISIKDFEELELMKADYLKYCFDSAKKDLDRGVAVDGKDFLNSL